MQTLPMIELLHSIATPFTFRHADSSAAQIGGTTADSSINSISTPFDGLLEANDLFDGSANVSNFINQVIFASSSGPSDGIDPLGDLASAATTAAGDSMNNDSLLGLDLVYGRNETVVREFIFDRTDVRIIFITLYSLVFFCCFFGEYK